MMVCPVCNAIGTKYILKWIATSFDGIDVTRYKCLKCGGRWQSTPRKSEPPKIQESEDDNIEMYISYPYGGNNES